MFTISWNVSSGSRDLRGEGQKTWKHKTSLKLPSFLRLFLTRQRIMVAAPPCLLQLLFFDNIVNSGLSYAIKKIKIYAPFFILIVFGRLLSVEHQNTILPKQNFFCSNPCLIFLCVQESKAMFHKLLQYLNPDSEAYEVTTVFCLRLFNWIWV